MTKKSTTVKVKSRLAMMAFVAVSFVAISTTSIGIAGYIVNHGGQTTTEQFSAVVAPFLAASLPSSLPVVEGK